MKGSLLAGRYQIEEEIGRGGMAVVYRGFDRSLERQVAVKVLHPELVPDEETVARFRAEAQSAAKLSHPSIVQIYDTGEDDGHHFIVMEYLPEPDLKSVIRNYAPLPTHKVAEVALQACEALGYAHQHGIIHRDVKPHNILFTTEGRAKLSDFGIAAAVDQRTSDTALVGSAHYLSPEEVHGNAPTPQSDIYSLGVLMYECLTGRTPFQGETTEAIIAKRLAGPPRAPRSLNADIPPAAEHVVLKAMAQDPHQRYQSAGEMLGDLRRLAAGAPVADAEVEATRTMVLPRQPEPVSAAPVREAGPGPRQPAPPTPARKEGLNWVWGVGGFLAGVAALVALVFLFQHLLYPGEGKYVTVPGVTGVSREHARQVLEEAGLVLGRVREDEEAEQAAGTVTEQTPEMGTRVPEDTEVDIVVAAPQSAEDSIVKVISVVGLSLEDAKANLQTVHLQVGRVQDVYDDEAPAGKVIRQGIPAGTEVAKGEAVDLWVSEGPQPPTVEATEPNEDGDDEGTDEPPEDADPSFERTENEDYAPDDPTLRQFRVTVIVQGTRDAQHIQIVLRDDRNIRNVVYEGWHDPTDKVEQDITTHGSATFELWRDGTLVGRAPLPLGTTDSDDDEPVEEPETD